MSKNQPTSGLSSEMAALNFPNAEGLAVLFRTAFWYALLRAMKQEKMGGEYQKLQEVRGMLVSCDPILGTGSVAEFDKLYLSLNERIRGLIKTFAGLMRTNGEKVPTDRIAKNHPDAGILKTIPHLPDMGIYGEQLSAALDYFHFRERCDDSMDYPYWLKTALNL